MEKEEKELLATIKQEVNATIEEKLKGLVSDEKLEGLKKMVEEKVASNDIAIIKDVVSKLEVELKAMKESGATIKKASLRKLVEENETSIKGIKKNGGAFHQMELKAFQTDTIGGVWTDFLEPQYIDGIVKTPDRKADFNVLQYVTVGQAFAEIVKWIEEDVETGEALFIDECVQKPDVSKTWVRNQATVRKVADYTRVCDEVLMYLEWAEQEIRFFLQKLVYKAIQEAIINGDGVGENLLGITPQATAFIAGGLATSTPQANEADAIAAMATQIANLGFTPNYAFVNTIDLYKLRQALKATDGQYLETRAGVPLVDCPFIPAGSVLVGDFSKSNVRFKQDIVVEMGMNGEDFRENAVSLRGEAFLTHYIATNEIPAFVYDTFTNVIAAIDKP